MPIPSFYMNPCWDHFTDCGLFVKWMAKEVPKQRIMDWFAGYFEGQSMIAMNGAGEINPTRLFTVLQIKEAKFVAQIIERHPESAALWTDYKNAIADVSKSSTKKMFLYVPMRAPLLLFAYF
ncbi:uncharacterized protein LOC131035718 [Cryptomeria japonica]|uniref:uncharacterized protein LOC131035718 n=1 Tax=Cryptomeria japonica TaxID=3369 RepID=UPI0027DA9B4B|nr:uncharacterized protein LOC131035718 [Cryptomeria japonica]